MIIDNVKNIPKYAALLPQLKRVPEILANADLSQANRVDFEGGFYFVQKGTTKHIKDTVFETHEEYIDVQILLKGKEYMGWDIRPNLTVT